jgi:hypothetical protein
MGRSSHQIAVVTSMTSMSLEPAQTREFGALLVREPQV